MFTGKELPYCSFERVRDDKMTSIKQNLSSKNRKIQKKKNQNTHVGRILPIKWRLSAKRNLTFYNTSQFSYMNYPDAGWNYRVAEVSMENGNSRFMKENANETSSMIIF